MYNTAKKVEEYVSFLEGALSERYESMTNQSGQTFFRLKGGSAANVIGFSKDGSINVQYADNIFLAQKGVFPWDGDGFSVNLMTKEDMLKAIIHEIEEE